MVKVSVCIPSYNNPELFKKCLDSILAQDFKDYEIVVSDDSTNDKIKNIIEELSISNLKYSHNSKPFGSPENWNNAISKASGKYIKIMHHDDYFSDKTSLGKFVKALEQNPKIDFAFCYTRIHFKADNSVYVNKQTKSQLKKLSEDTSFLFFRNIIGSPSAVFFKNDNSIIFNKNYKWLVDVEFYIKYLSKHKNFINIPEVLVIAIDGAEGQVTHDVTKDKKIVISENLNLFSEIYSDKLNNKKSFLYFQELFETYKIITNTELNELVEIPNNLTNFISNVFLDWPKNKLAKKVKKRLLTSRYNKRIFKIERF